MFVGQEILVHRNRADLPGVDHWTLFASSGKWRWTRRKQAQYALPSVGRVDDIINFGMASHAERTTPYICSVNEALFQFFALLGGSCGIEFFLKPKSYCAF
jgi:hypothetical protein